MKDHAHVEVIKEKYRRLQDEMVAAMERGDMEPEEAVERSEGLEKEMEWEMEKVRDFAQWEKGEVDEDDEIEELSEEAVKKAKARAKGKEKEKKEEKKKTTRAKRRRIEDSDGEEDMAPGGWRPSQGSQVRSKYTIS